VKAAPPETGNKTEQAPHGTLRFAGFALDLEKGLLSKNGKPIDLRPKSYALLHYLALHSGRVLSKDELLAAVWSDVTVTEDSLTQCIRDIRLALGDEGQTLIRTLPRRGYVFDLGQERAEAPLETDDGKPTIAVLPFRFLGSNASQSYIADGITEDIITALARFSGLTITGLHAVSHAAVAGLDLKDAAHLLGVRHVVDGSVRLTNNHIRITARLVTAESGIAIWAEHYDRPLEDVFAIQDEVVTSITAALDGKLVSAVAGSARRKTSANWSAYDCLMQGRDLCNQHQERKALPFLDDAVRRDPTSAQAHAWRAIASTVSFANTNERAFLVSADTSAIQALQCDDHDATAHWALAMANTWNGRLQDCSRHFDRAMQLNPANIQIRGDHANWLRYSGRTREALEEIDYAITHDQFAPHWFHAIRGSIRFDLKDYAGALYEYEKLPFPNPHMHMMFVSICGHLGDIPGAQSNLAKVLEVVPDFSISNAVSLHPYGDEGLRSHMIEGLRRAGVAAS
jgi:adenylate cyclase